MHVLVTEAHAGDSDRLVRRLRAVGVRVTACHEGVAFCQALEPGGGCPLDDFTDHVDLVVDVRGAGDELHSREYGVICAERARRPVWIISNNPDAPVVVPVAVREFAIPATEEELLVECQRRHRDHNRPLTSG